VNAFVACGWDREELAASDPDSVGEVVDELFLVLGPEFDNGFVFFRGRESDAKDCEL